MLVVWDAFQNAIVWRHHSKPFAEEDASIAQYVWTQQKETIQKEFHKWWTNKRIFLANKALQWVKIKHLHGALAEWSVSVLPGWKRKWNSDVWGSNPQRIGEGAKTSQPCCQRQRLEERGYYWAVGALWVTETLWAPGSAVTQWWIHSITSWKCHLLQVSV